MDSGDFNGGVDSESGVSVDEKTIDFQSNHINKMQINYNADDDGFQCVAL